MKFPTLILFFTITAATISGQKSYDEPKRSDVDKFRVLGDYYIDDTGLVVYRGTSGSEQSKTSNSAGTVSSSNDVRVIYESAPEPYIVNRVSDNTVNTKGRQPVNAQPEPPIRKYTPAPKSSAPVVVARKETKPVAPSAPVRKPEVKTASEYYPDEATTSQNASQSKPKSVNAQSSKSSGSVFEKRKSEYRNMEEAALAVESLLDELKKEQVGLKGSGSMSSRLSRGVTKDLRKSVPKTSQSPYRSVNSEDDAMGYADQDAEYESEYGLRPSYFINGIQVDKNEVSKLNKRDIISREIRTRNTVTDNPNGEIWYTVQSDAEVSR